MKRFKIEINFLRKDPTTWTQDENFQKGLNIVKGLKIVNDTAESAVILVESYVNTLSRDEEQKQFLMQILSDYRKQFSDSSKQMVEKEKNLLKF